MNLYRVSNKDYEWCCYVFETTRNKAKAFGASCFGEDYTDMRCTTLKKGINVDRPRVVDCEDDEGHDIVLKCGYRFATEEECLG